MSTKSTVCLSSSMCTIPHWLGSDSPTNYMLEKESYLDLYVTIP